jgi:type IV pilus assembly protein PilC
MEKTLRIQKRIRKAMVYPTMVVIVAVAVTLGMLLFVLPSFKSIYKQFNAELPTLTTLLLAASDFLGEHGAMAGLACGGFIYGLLLLYKRNNRFQQSVDKMLLYMPIFGDLLITAFHARWTRTFATLNASGVPITSTLESVASVARIESFKKILLELRQQVATGTRVSDGMEKFKLFPPDAVQMIRIGEESGRLDEMLERLANQYETQLDDKVDNLSTVIEPMIMAVIGGLVGVLIVGMYLPIFNIGNVV